MARENTISLHGQLIDNPRLFADEVGNVKRALFHMKVLRRAHITESGQLASKKEYIHSPIIATSNPELAKKISLLQKHDMVDVKGVMTTREVLKKSTCECGMQNAQQGNYVYITAIYICRRETGIDEETGMELLYQRREISNSAIFIGTLCRDPLLRTFTKEDDKEDFICQYQLAINRKYHIKEEQDSIRTDYPWVKSFGDQAQKDASILSTNSTIAINGAVQTREVSRKVPCIACGTEYPYRESILEIYPHTVQYLLNCNPPEEEPELVDIVKKPEFENIISLHGQVIGKPRIELDNEGVCTRAAFFIRVLRRPYITSAGQVVGGRLYLDNPIIATRDPDLAEKISDLREHDMVDIRGMLTTREVPKKSTCECGTENMSPGTFTYIAATYVCKRESGIDAEKGLELLKERNEVSNTVIIMGTLVGEPEVIEEDALSCEYKIAVARKFHIRDESQPEKTDYPIIKSYGNQAKDDALRLNSDSSVSVNGAVQTRQIEKAVLCSECGLEYISAESALEIYPHSVEYLRNCYFPEREELEYVVA